MASSLLKKSTMTVWMAAISSALLPVVSTMKAMQGPWTGLEKLENPKAGPRRSNSISEQAKNSQVHVIPALIPSGGQVQSPREGHSIPESEFCSIDSAQRISPSMIRISRKVSSVALAKSEANCDTSSNSEEEQAIASAIAISFTASMKLLKPVAEVRLSKSSASDS